MDKILWEVCTPSSCRHFIVMVTTERGTSKSLWGNQIMKTWCRFTEQITISLLVNLVSTRKKIWDSRLSYENLQSCFEPRLIAMHNKRYFCYTNACLIALERWLTPPSVFSLSPKMDKDTDFGAWKSDRLLCTFFLLPVQRKTNLISSRKQMAQWM